MPADKKGGEQEMNSIIIDAYSHISPLKYTEFIKEKYPSMYNNLLGACVPLYDMDTRFRIMDRFPEVVQVLTIGPVPPIEYFANQRQTVELAKMANDEMAELCLKYRDRFVAAIALLPMNNINAALKETDRAIRDLGFKGIYVHSNINGKPLDAPEFLPLWEKMVKYDLPIYIHPWRPPEFSDYATEKGSKYYIATNFGWPYETTVAMTRLIFSGILDKCPNLKIVTHHCGGMVSFYAGRIYQHYGTQIGNVTDIAKPPLEYYKMFYTDTAIHGNTPALMLAHDFWGPDKLLFGADLPLGDSFWGSRSYRVTINAINDMKITDEDKEKIFADNARKLLRIPI
jgi:predicted TIM-barrel fold metal-dependent hydrolase